MSIRVRFAPSPTGFLHVGGARTALFNWLLARREGGVFVLRIEDTDRERSSEAMVEAILHGMRWLGLEWDEGPFFQGAGVERHREDALRLLAEGWAFRDFVPPEELAGVREEDPNRALRYPRERAELMGEAESLTRAEAGEPFAIRFRVPDGGETAWEDEVYGPIRFRNDEIEDLVILRSDGTPTYNLAVVSDDAEMRITHVLRGEDHISNTPKQILIHQALGNSVPIFGHLPMILGPDGKRLSKRHGATAVGEYEKEGILPAAMVNFLALLGWSPGDDEEVMSPDELVARFSLDRVLRKSAVFDVRKLEWLNGRHLAATPAAELVSGVLSALEDGDPEPGLFARDRWNADPAWFVALVELLKVRARTVREIAAQVRPFLTDTLEYDPHAVAKHWAKDPGGAAGHLEALLQHFEGVEWEEGPLEEALRALADTRGVGAGKMIHPLRVALTGEEKSPGIFEVLVFLGRERALSRIRAGVEIVNELETHDS